MDTPGKEFITTSVQHDSDDNTICVTGKHQKRGGKLVSYHIEVEHGSHYSAWLHGLIQRQKT